MENEHIRKLYMAYFKNQQGKPFRLYNYQIPIARSILEEEKKRIVINATTRSGKSLTIALSCILYALWKPNRKVFILAPTYKQTRVIMDYIAEHITDSPWISEMVDIERKMDLERLRKEVSKERITFKNKSQITILSAEGKGERLMGVGAELIIIDEAELVSDKVYRMRILRMLGDNPNSKLILVGNAIGQNFFYQASLDPDFYHIHINWEDCVREGRFTKEFIEEQRKRLTEAEFTMLYESEFVEDLESKLISKRWIDEAVYEIDEKPNENTIYGLDIAEMGNDLSVLTGINEKKGVYKVVFLKSWEKKETMQTTGIVTKYILKENPINIDATGVGNGVWSRLKELGYNANKILVGSSSTREKNRFLNLKAQLYWNLRCLFEERRIKIPNEPRLIEQLNKMKYEITSNGKIKIIDPEDKSPDFADSLCLALIPRPKLYLSKMSFV